MIENLKQIKNLGIMKSLFLFFAFNVQKSFGIILARYLQTKSII